MYVNNDKYVNHLVNNLPPFYSEYMYNTDFIKHLSDAYIASSSLILGQIESKALNTRVDTTELYTNIEFSTLLLHSGLYDINLISKTFQTQGFGSWFDSNTSVSSKIKFLDDNGLYEDLKVTQGLGSNQDVVSFNISKDFLGISGNYKPISDYIIKNNRLYLFNDLAKFNSFGGTYKRVLLKDVFIDNRTLNNRWGVFIPTINNAYISNQEYRDLLRKAVSFTPTMDNVRDSVSIITSNISGSIYDAYSVKNPSDSALLSTYTINPFDIVYKLPSNLVTIMSSSPDILGDSQDTYELAQRLQTIKEFLKITRPAYSRLYLMGSSSFKSTLSIRDSVVIKKANQIVDNYGSNVSDVVSSKLKTSLVDEFYTTTTIYDDNFYDDEYYYDTGDIVSVRLIQG